MILEALTYQTSKRIAAENSAKPSRQEIMRLRLLKQSSKHKSGGKALYVKLENDDGQYVTDYLNFVHKTSQQAVDIGKRRMKEMLVCGGHPTPDKPGSVEKIKGLKLGARVVQGARLERQSW